MLPEAHHVGASWRQGLRVVLVDDHALFRAGLASLLGAWGLDIVGQASDGKEGVGVVRELKPDLVFMDVNMPTMGGLEATRAIKSELPDMTVIILTVSDDERDLFEAIKSGADGYLLKNLQEDEFANLIERLAKGEPVMSPHLAKKLLQEFARISEERSRPTASTDLTAREQDVLDQLAHGAPNKEIASVLFISENTVNYHMKNILSKLHLKNRSQVTAWAIEHGFSANLPA